MFMTELIMQPMILHRFYITMSIHFTFKFYSNGWQKERKQNVISIPEFPMLCRLMDIVLLEYNYISIYAFL